MSKEMHNVEIEFIGDIQAGKFDLDRQMEAFCSFRICKKRAFIAAFNSLTERSGDKSNSNLIDSFRQFPINYRPLAVLYPILRERSQWKFHYRH